MTILFDATRQVKTTHRFGRGILRSLPTYHSPVSSADEAWLVADNARREREAVLMAREEAETNAFHAHLEEMYEQSLESSSERGFDFLSHAEA
jgi:hypothetical protein